MNGYVIRFRGCSGALQADSARSGHVVVEADIFVDKEEDTITWLFAAVRQADIHFKWKKI
jgi:hypothetical protein